MSETELARVGRSLPRIRSVSLHDGYEIAVTWDAATRNGASEIVDIAPLLLRLKFYAPLRENRELMDTVHTIDEGTAIAWGIDEIDMAASSVLNLAEENMSAADFGAFMKRHKFTFERVAAELGISKRLAAYYAAGQAVPRYIWLACQFIDQREKADSMGAEDPRSADALRPASIERNLAQ